MKMRIAGSLAFAVLVLGAGFIGSPVSAKCGKDCKTAIRGEFRMCKAACPKGKAGKACKKACRDEKKSDVTACKSAANPTPPNCGEASPSPAFVD